MLSIKVNYDGDSSKTFLCSLLFSKKHNRMMVFCDDSEEMFREATNPKFYDSIEIIEHSISREVEAKLFKILQNVSVFEPIYTVYEHDRVYGGAEEGGWYYSTYEALNECSFEEYDNQTKDDCIYCGIFYGEREDLSTHHYC